jgi:GxxExxY protein
MQVELEAQRLKAETERPIKVIYKGVIVGPYEADLLVADRVIVELRIAKAYQSADEAQLLRSTNV